MSLIRCHDCDLLQKISHLPEDGAVKCCRCSALLRNRQHINPEDSIQHSLALVLTAMIILIIVNSFPLISIDIEGRKTTASLFFTVQHLFQHDMKFVAGLIFFTCIGAPLIQLSGLLYVLFPLSLGLKFSYSEHVYRWAQKINSWSMLEIFMLGILVVMVKLAAIATVIPGIALWATVILIFVIAGVLVSLDNEVIWDKLGQNLVESGTQVSELNNVTTNCHDCNYFCIYHGEREGECPRCGAELHSRKPDSLNRSTALLLAAIMLYLPANLLPMMEVTHFGRTQSDTIISGSIFLLKTGHWPLALVVFFASVFIPILKILILSLLIISIHLKTDWLLIERTRLYRLTELIGRWSMVDIYVVALMASLIQVQGLSVVDVGTGAIAFAAVVILTMLSAMAFDPRLLWDNARKDYE